MVISHQNLGEYVYANTKMVQEANRTMRLSCHEEFVSWKGIVDPFWFTEREMPEDAWEKTEEGKAAMAEAEERNAAQGAVQSDETEGA